MLYCTYNTIHHKKGLYFGDVKNNVHKNIKCSWFDCSYCNVVKFVRSLFLSIFWYFEGNFWKWNVNNIVVNVLRTIKVVILAVFCHLLGYLFFEFSAFWISEEPESVMVFNQVRDKFAVKITTLLKNPSTVLELKYKTLHDDDASLASVSTLDREWLSWYYILCSHVFHPAWHCL